MLYYVCVVYTCVNNRVHVMINVRTDRPFGMGKKSERIQLGAKPTE